MLKALGTKLVIERVEQEQKSASGILLTNMQDPNPMATVISKGDDVTIKAEEGDSVAISWNNTAQQKYLGKNYYIVDQSGVFGKGV